MRAKTEVRIYKPKSLIDGSVIGMERGSQWVAVPDKFAGKPICVVYGGVEMDIKDWKTEAKLFKRFRDKYWREGSGRPQYYTLGYFRFEPTKGY